MRLNVWRATATDRMALIAQDLAVSDEFMEHGGTEVAPMSTTSDLAVAVQYSDAQASLLHVRSL